MATRSWTITDVQTGTYLDELTVGPDDIEGMSGKFSVRKSTLRGGLSHGVDTIKIDNGTFSFVVLPTRGMSLGKAWRGDVTLGWNSPVRGPVHPKYVPLAEPSGLGWLDGFDELLVRCGLESNGAPEFQENGQLLFPLHGRIGNKPAHKVELTIDGGSGEITLVGVVEEIRFHIFKLRMTTTIKTKIGEPGLRITDTIKNLSGSPTEFQMLYHTNFGEPLLDAGSRFLAPIKTLVPRNDHAASGIKNWSSYAAPQAGFEEQVYFMELLADSTGKTQTLLKNAHSTAGVSMIFNKKQLPCFTVWKNTTSPSDGYVTGLEPGTNFPNPRSYEGQQGRVVKLPAGGSFSFDLQLVAHTEEDELKQAEKEIAALQSAAEPKIFDKPQEGWCDGA